MPSSQGRMCSHCMRTARGCAQLNDHHLCHPDAGMDCYHLVTVYHHAMPCMASSCRSLLAIEQLIMEYPLEAMDELRKLGYDVRVPGGDGRLHYPGDSAGGLMWCVTCHRPWPCPAASAFVENGR